MKEETKITLAISAYLILGATIAILANAINAAFSTTGNLPITTTALIIIGWPIYLLIHALGM